MNSVPSTIYRVEITSRAARDLELLYDYIQAETAPQAATWFNGLEAAVFSLDQLPERGAFAPGSKTRRQILYGSKPYVYRIVYVIRLKDRVVSVIYIRHSARRIFTR
jgi:plasmid stabilization system protein ParE